MVDLSDDVINIILAKLPVISLLRFRNVCKQWDAIITSHAFSAQHIKYKSTLSACMVVNSYHPHICPDDSLLHAIQISTSHQCSPTAIPYSIKLRCRGGLIDDIAIWCNQLISSCNGLLCVARLAIRNQGFTNLFMQVCNPATGIYIDIERLPVFAFDQIQSWGSILLGFGYDPTTDDYKIVYMFKPAPPSSEPPVVLVMSLKSNAWRPVDPCASPDLSCVVSQVPKSNNPVACSGGLYWIVRTTNREGRYKVMILKCNLTEERFELLPFPDRAEAVNDEEILFCNILSKLTSHKGSLYIFMPQHSDHTRRTMTSSESIFTSKLDMWMLERMDGNNAIWAREGVIPTFEGAMLNPIGLNCSGHVIMKSRPSGDCWLINLYSYLPKKNEFVELGTTSYNLDIQLVEMETSELNW